MQPNRGCLWEGVAGTKLAPRACSLQSGARYHVPGYQAHRTRKIPSPAPSLPLPEERGWCSTLLDVLYCFPCTLSRPPTLPESPIQSLSQLQNQSSRPFRLRWGEGGAVLRPREIRGPFNGPRKCHWPSLKWATSPAPPLPACSTIN